MIFTTSLPDQKEDTVMKCYKRESNMTHDTCFFYYLFVRGKSYKCLLRGIYEKGYIFGALQRVMELL